MVYESPQPREDNVFPEFVFVNHPVSGHLVRSPPSEEDKQLMQEAAKPRNFADARLIFMFELSTVFNLSHKQTTITAPIPVSYLCLS